VRRGRGLATTLIPYAATLVAAGALAACAVEPVRLVSLSLPEDTADTAGPYLVQAELRGDLDGRELIVCWSVDNASFTTARAHARAGRDDLRFAELPGQPAGTTVSFLLVLVDEGGPCPAFDASVTLRSFRVVTSTSGCVVDSDCASGAICAGGACVAYDGTCADGSACPGGLTCDQAASPPTCVVAPRTCLTGADCPSLEECDVARGECVAPP
jgi:hypothetical protein